MFGSRAEHHNQATFGPAMAAVARNFTAELLNGRRIAIPIRLNMTVRELKEELKDFQPTDETAKMLSAVDIIVEGEQLNDLEAIVSETIPTVGVHVQVVFSMPPPILCIMKELAGCNVEDLRDVRVPFPQTRIPTNGFEGCHALLRVDIADSVTQLGNFAFRDCSSLRAVTIEGVTQISIGAFCGCSSLTALTIPRSVTRIGHAAFRGCSSLASLVIPATVMSIGSGAFADCSSLRSLAIPDAVTGIGEGIFDGCSSLTNLKIPRGVTTFGKRACIGCSSLTRLAIPCSVTEIGEAAFVSCSSLRSLSIPESVMSIGRNAFAAAP